MPGINHCIPDPAKTAQKCPAEKSHTKARRITADGRETKDEPQMNPPPLRYGATGSGFTQIGMGRENVKGDW
jgi:hypothetical protein